MSDTTLVVTAKMTHDDIAEARRRHPQCCPVARCVTRTLGLESGSVSVLGGAIKVPGYWWERLPEHVWGFAMDFDNGENVQPIEFTIELECKPSINYEERV